MRLPFRRAWSTRLAAVVVAASATGCHDPVAPILDNPPQAAEAKAARSEPHHPLVRVFGALDADSAAYSMALSWAASGNRSLLDRWERRSSMSGSAGQRGARLLHRARGSVAATASMSNEPIPTQQDNPQAEILDSETYADAMGTNGYITSMVLFHGNWAVSDVSYSAYAGSTVIIPPYRQKSEGKTGFGDCDPYIAGYWYCQWTFRLNTTVSLNLQRMCGVEVTTNADHAAMFTASPFPAPIGTLGAWGHDYRADPVSRAQNGPCGTCDDPMTPLEEDCDDYPPYEGGQNGGQQGSSGSTVQIIETPDAASDELVCPYIDWEWVYPGGARVYLGRQWFPCYLD